MLLLPCVILFHFWSVSGKPVTQVPQTRCPHLDGCFYASKCYSNGEEISRKHYDRNGCGGLVCVNGNAIYWDDQNCATTTPTSSTPPYTQGSTTQTSTPRGCIDFDGKWYPPGSEVSRGSDGNGWCYGTYCTEDGHLTTWDDWNCKPNTADPASSKTPAPMSTPEPTPSTLATTSAPVPTTFITPLRCFHNGVWYAPGSEISRVSDGNRLCYGIYCTDDGQVAEWNSGDCKPNTADPASSSTTPTPTRAPSKPMYTSPTPFGCFQNGVWYAPGSEISRGSDGNGWCYGTYCAHDGGLRKWDDWNCKPTSPTAGPPSISSASTPTTVPPPLGCFQNGAWYEPGSEISRASDGEGWCHGISCDTNGKIVAWDDWNCEETDENSEPTTKPERGCYYGNQWHPSGSISEGSDSNGCRYGVICGDDGQVTRWDEFDCPSIKTK